MKKLNGIWWTLNQKKIPGTLTITDDNKIWLTTQERLQESNIINGFVEGTQITLVDTELDRTDIYYDNIEKNDEQPDVTTEIEMKYETYKYLVKIVILGHVYERKGDIKLKEIELTFTNLDKWVEWECEVPKVKVNKNGKWLKLNGKESKKFKLNKFDISIIKPYEVTHTKYNMEINNRTAILINNIASSYIYFVEVIIEYIEFFLVLCMGDNINVEKINAIDRYGRQIEIILGYRKTNYENRYIFKNIIKFKDIESDFSEILQNWLDVYEDNELLISSFIVLQKDELLLANEYNSLTTAIDSLYLLITNKRSSNDQFIDEVKKILKETNFILNLTEDEIGEIAYRVKEARRYFTHSNKTRRDDIRKNINVIKLIVSILIEVIRARIMIHIGVDEKLLCRYYQGLVQLKDVKNDIINNFDCDDEVKEVYVEDKKEGNKMSNKEIKTLSKNDRNNIAELNSIMDTRYRETGYNLENTKDLIEAVQFITAEFLDYDTYWNQLQNILEDFDQSMEVFSPASWMSTIKKDESEDFLIDQIYANLNETSDNMLRLMNRAEQKCAEIWKILLFGDNKEAREFFVGDLTGYSENDIDEMFENISEVLEGIEHCNVVEDDCRNFANSVKAYLEFAVKGEKE